MLKFGVLWIAIKYFLHILQYFILLQAKFTIKNSTAKMFDETTCAVSYLKKCGVHA